MSETVEKKEKKIQSLEDDDEFEDFPQQSEYLVKV